MDAARFASLVDHTLLKPEATREQIEALCEEARQLHTASVCTNGLWVPTVSAALAGSGVLVCSVVGFPLGATTPTTLAYETGEAVEHGADEIDMVLAVGLLVADDDTAAGEHIAAARRAAPDTTLKVILETALLDDEQIVRASTIAVDSGADFVKTSTGFNPAGGATTHAVELMRGTVGSDIGVKASGGVRTLADVEAMIAAGASRLGMSATAQVIAEIERNTGQ